MASVLAVEVLVVGRFAVYSRRPFLFLPCEIRRHTSLVVTQHFNRVNLIDSSSEKAYNKNKWLPAGDYEVVLQLFCFGLGGIMAIFALLTAIAVVVTLLVRWIKRTLRRSDSESAGSFGDWAQAHGHAGEE